MFWWIFLVCVLVTFYFLCVRSIRAGHGKLLAVLTLYPTVLCFLVSLPARDSLGHVIVRNVLAWLVLGVPLALVTWWILPPWRRGL